MSSDADAVKRRSKSKPEVEAGSKKERSKASSKDGDGSAIENRRSRSVGRKKERKLKESAKKEVLKEALKETKESKDSKEAKDPKEVTDSKEIKDTREKESRKEKSGRRSRSKSRDRHSKVGKGTKEAKEEDSKAAADEEAPRARKGSRKSKDSVTTASLFTGVEFISERDFRRSGAPEWLGGGGAFTHVLCIVDEPSSDILEGLKAIKHSSHVALGSQSQFLTQMPLCHQHLVLGKSTGKALVVYDEKKNQFAAALAVTLLISLLDETTDEAEDTVRNVLPGVALTDKEREEVALWEGMGGMINMKDPKWALFMAARKIDQEEVLKAMLTQSSKVSQQSGATPLSRRFSMDGRKGKRVCTTASLDPTTSTTANERAEKHLKSWKNGSLQPVELNSPGAGSAGYYCIKCKKRLFTAENILANSMQREQERTQFFIEPMRWMGELTESSGQISCYNCQTELGSWKWGTLECAGTKEPFKPGFAVDKATVTLEQLQRAVAPPSPATKKQNRRSMLMGRLGFGREQEEGGRSRSKERDSPVVATCYEELPKDMQKSLSKAKITPELANENWKVTSLVLKFVHKRAVCTQEKAEKLIALRAARKAKEEEAKTTDAKTSQEADDASDGAREAEREEAEAAADEDKKAEINPDDFGFLVKPCPFETYGYRSKTFIDTATEALISKGDCLAKYKIQDQLGSGGFGRVYLAKGPRGEKYAVKKMPHDTRKQQRLNLREVCMLHNCRHDNIVRYTETFIVKKEMWVVMEYMEGGTLKEANDRHNFSEVQIAYIAKFSLKALEYLHHNGIVHRDLKPINIMLTVDAIVKIIDFGLAEDTMELVRKPRMVGSAFWMPPEVIRGEPHGPPADIWSLGMTLLQLANNERQFKSSVMRALFVTATTGYPTPFKHPNEWSATFRDFIAKLLEFDQNVRPSATELLDHEFLNKATTRKRMEKVLSNIFLQGIEETFFM